jgi:hypothetical protein
LKPGPNFLKDPSGNPLPLTAVGLWSPPQPAAASLTLAPTATTNALTTAVTVTATATTAAGGPVPNTPVFLDIIAGPNANAIGPAITDANGQVTLTYSGGPTTGTDQIRAHIGSVISNIAAVTWTPGPLDHITVSPVSATIAAGGIMVYSSQAFDTFNNVIGDVTSNAGFSISPDGSCTAATCTATLPGPHTVTATYNGKPVSATLTVTSAPIDRTPQVTVTYGGVSLVRATNRWVQNVTIKNVGTTVFDGPVSLIVSGLSSNATVYAPTGTASTFYAGSPYKDLNILALAPGASASVVLEFSKSGSAAITYVAKVVTGSGGR